MLDRLKKIFRRRTRRRGTQNTQKTREEPKQGSSPGRGGDRDAIVPEVHQSLGLKPPGADHKNTRVVPAGDTNAIQNSHRETLTSDELREDEHPAVRPLSLDLRPRSPVQHLKHPDAPRRDSDSSLYSNADFSTPPQSAHPAEDSREPSSSQQAAPPKADDGRLEPAPYHELHNEPEEDVDYTLDTRKPVTHEVIKPHVHTIYEPRRTRSIHFEEHRYYIQPILDPNPEPAAGQAAFQPAKETALGTGSLLQRNPSNY
ncbi:hypothetical protein HJFPF1_08700 [Paramyrothecium foliicola]|nr:hypothetical protein HJFPF1_08700 [Paramyrothecium foliicola]